MRPRLIASENDVTAATDGISAAASMRPRLIASENLVLRRLVSGRMAGFNEAEAHRLGKPVRSRVFRHQCPRFNEAEAHRLGKLRSGRKFVGCELASMRPRLIASENVFR